MNSLVIYDTVGSIISIQSGSPTPKEPVGIPFLWVDIPSNKTVSSIDVTVTPNIPSFIDIPKTEVEILNKQVADLQYTLMMNGVI